MKCFGTGMIQSYIDGELDISMKKEIQKHLEECEKCGREYETLKKTDDMVFAQLSAYKQYCDENFAASGKHHHAEGLRSRHGEKKQVAVLKNKGFIFKYKKAFTAACIAAVLTICVTVQPVRAFIAEALNIFRVENVKSFQISYADMEEIRRKLEEKQGDIELENFGKIMVEGFSEQRMTIDEAKAMEDPAILLPPDANDDNLELAFTQPGMITFTMDVKNVNEALKSFGSVRLLPDSLDGKTFTAYFTAQAKYMYHQEGSFFSVEQMKSPELAVPSGVDVDEMYECLAELPVLPKDIRRQLQSVKDWKNTIYLPVTSEPQEVDVNGSKGFIAERKNGGWTLVWHDEGNLFCVSSNAGKEEIIDFAGSLR